MMARSLYPVSREGWPHIFLHPSQFFAADLAGLVERQPDRMLLRGPGLDFIAVIHILSEMVVL